MWCDGSIWYPKYQNIATRKFQLIYDVRLSRLWLFSIRTNFSLYCRGLFSLRYHPWWCGVCLDIPSTRTLARESFNYNKRLGFLLSDCFYAEWITPLWIFQVRFQSWNWDDWIWYPNYQHVTANKFLLEMDIQLSVS